MATFRFRRERVGHTLQPTALVHEAFLRLIGSDKQTDWQNRRHFFAAASEAMRRILVEQARKRTGPKAGGQLQRLALDDVEANDEPNDWIIEVNDAIEALSKEDPVAAELVKLRIFAGMNLDEAAEVTQMSRTSAFRTWTFARAWLKTKLSETR